MSLANLKSPFGAPGTPPPDQFDPTKIATQMQTDPNVRTMFAQFFSDPASRHFVQDSGDITTALARPDNPWTPGAPVVTPNASTVQPGGAPGASLASAPAAIAPGTPQEPGMPPVYTGASDYAAAHPEAVMVPPRPVAPMDNVHGARRALMLAFLGLNKFGAGLDHQQNSYADEFLGRQLSQSQAQSQYDTSAPQLKHQAEEAAYNTYLGQQSKVGELERTAAETKNLGLNVPMLQRQQALIDKVRTLKESGKYSNDQDLMNAVLPEARTIPGMTQQMLTDAIASSKTLGSKYTLTRDPQTEQPIELVDRQGNHYSASNLPADPEAKQMWTDAETAAAGKLSTEEGKEKRVAGYAADRQAAGIAAATASQARNFEHADVEKGRTEATKHLGDIRNAQGQSDLINTLLSGKMSPSAQTTAVYKLVGLQQPEGSHRVMPAEVQGWKQLGGWSDRAAQWFANAKEGDQFPPELLPDIISTAKTIAENKVKTANDNLEDVHRVYGYHVNGADPNTGRLDGAQSVYGGAGASGAGGQGKVATSQHIADYAAKKYPNDPQGVAKATAEFKSAGWTIQ